MGVEQIHDEDCDSFLSRFLFFSSFLPNNKLGLIDEDIAISLHCVASIL